MFKGLKTKLADETKRLQATALQVGENLAQSVRNRTDGTSEHGSERGSTTGRLVDVLGDVLGVNHSTPTSTNGASRVEHDVTSPSTGNLIDISDNSMTTRQPALMQEVSEDDFLDSPHVRQRRLSNSSVGSNDSMSIFPTLPTLGSNRLETINSDVESMATDLESNAGSAFLGRASKEQISSVLHKLQGRAANYKDKYRDLVKNYNEVIRENDKCRTVLAATQDKALQRIDKLREEKRLMQTRMTEIENQIRAKMDERDNRIVELERQISVGSVNGGKADDSERVKKLEELLNRCKENIRNNKEKISQLTIENDQLRATAINAENEKEGDGGFRDLAAERLAAEWRTKLQSSEREWEIKLQEETERSAMAVAQTKAEMHAALEEKDEALEKLRHKYRQFEATYKEETGTHASRMEEMNSTINALEAEKADMVEKLSKAKQEAVRIVQEEESKKRDELVADLDERLKAKEVELDARIGLVQAANGEELKKVENEWRMRLKEQEEQHLLAIEEREMQKAASFVEHDRRHDDLGTTIEQLTTEKLQLTSAIDQLKEKHRKQIEELSATIEANAARHKEEIATMLSAHDEILSSAKKDDQDVAATVTRQLQETSAQLKDATTRMQQLEMDLAAEVSSAQAANKAVAEMQQRHAAELEQLRGELDECQRRADDAVEQRERAQGEMDKLRSDNHQFTEELADLRQKLDKTQMDSAGEIERLNQYVDELKMKVDDKTDALSTALKESESLTIELAASKELSAIHERLQEELDSARRDRDETERHAQKLQAELKTATASLETETANSQRLLAELDAAREDFHRKLNDSANNDELTEQHRREEITDLTTRIEALRQEAAESKSHLAQVTSEKSAELEQKTEEIERLNRDLTTNQEQLAAARVALKEHEDEMAVLRAQRNALESDNDALKVKQDELSKALEAREWDCDKLELQLSELQGNVDQRAEEASGLKEQLKQLEERLAAAAAEADQVKVALAAKDAIAGDAERKDAEMQELLEAKDAETRKLIEQKSTETQQLLDAKDAEMRQLLDAKDAETRNMLENKQAEFEQLMEKRNSEVEEKQQLVTGLQASIAEKDNQIAVFSDSRETGADQLAALEQRAQELTEAKQKLMEEVADLRSRNDKGSELLEQLRTETSQLREQLVERERQLEQSQLNMGQLTAECEEKTLKVQSLLADIEVWESSEKEKTSTLEEAKAEVAALREQLSAIEHGSQNEKFALERRVLELELAAQANADELARFRSAHDQQLSSLDEKELQLMILKQESDSFMNQAQSQLAALKEQLDQSQLTNQQLEAALGQKDGESHAKVREIESALKQAQEELVAEKERSKELDAARIEVAQLQADMESLKLDASSERDNLTQETEKTVQETKRKAEIKLAKMKKQCETDVQAAKAELLLQLDQLRSDIADRDARLDELRLNLAISEQRLAEQAENEKIVEDMRAAKETLMDEKDRMAEMAQRTTLELDTVRVEMDKLRQQASDKDGKMEAAAELRSTVQRLEAELLEKEDKISSLLDQSHQASQVDQIRAEYEQKLANLTKQFEQRHAELIELHQQELKSTLTKSDGDNSRKAKEYQKEVKQLYKDLNDRTEELGQNTNKYETLLKEREDEINRLKAALDSGNEDTVFSDAHAVDHEELQNLRDRVRHQQKEIAEMRERHKREMEGVLQEAAASASATQVDNHHPPLKVQTSHFGSVSLDSFPTSPMFAEPTEAEVSNGVSVDEQTTASFQYLRNVLFRYMNERETLGKEIVTLAKVIGTVAKFSRDQLDSVLAKEEARNISWYGGTVNSVQSTVQSVLHR